MGPSLVLVFFLQITKHIRVPREQEIHFHNVMMILKLKASNKICLQVTNSEATPTILLSSTTVAFLQ